MTASETEDAELHPITKLFGDTGAFLFGSAGMMYLGTYVGIVPKWEIFADLTLLGLGLFLFGLCTIPVHLFIKQQVWPESF